MNIFVTSSDPEEAAIVLDDIRANKLILEGAQMLSGALRWYGYESDRIYKSTHVHHPCSLWARRSLSNFRWLERHTRALISCQGSYSHKSFPIIQKAGKEAGDIIPDRGLTPFANCAKNNELGLDFTFLPTIQAYRNYLFYRWKQDTIKLTWKGRESEKERIVKRWTLI